jgi:hypothetical protein
VARGEDGILLCLSPHGLHTALHNKYSHRKTTGVQMLHNGCWYGVSCPVLRLLCEVMGTAWGVDHGCWVVRLLLPRLWHSHKRTIPHSQQCGNVQLHMSLLVFDYVYCIAFIQDSVNLLFINTLVKPATHFIFKILHTRTLRKIQMLQVPCLCRCVQGARLCGEGSEELRSRTSAPIMQRNYAVC